MQGAHDQNQGRAYRMKKQATLARKAEKKEQKL
jgi:hypothetical protein